ncbi:MAG: plasmid pRiA4b ORF-3 family protein [Candidatus Dormibacteria bacterium]
MTAAKRRPAEGTPQSIHQLKVTLRHVSPPVWRRIQVPSNASLGELHFILQTAMGWDDDHLHLFSVRGAEYADGRVEDPWGVSSPKNEDRARLALVAPARTRLRYEYDFGDGWEHDLVVERVFPAEPGVTYPRCVTGRRACPPEDCGGPAGYADLLEALTEPANPRHQELLDWFEDGFDPEAFDPEAVSAWLGSESGSRP